MNLEDLLTSQISMAMIIDTTEKSNAVSARGSAACSRVADAHLFNSSMYLALCLSGSW